MRMRTALALIAAFISTSVLAQANPAPADAADQPTAAPWRAVPKLSPEGKRFLEGFRGKWKSNAVKLTFGDRDVPGKMRLDCTRSSGGWATLCKASFTAAGFRPEEDTYLLGWDLDKKQGHLFEVTSAAEVHDHAGAWTDEKTITLVHRGKSADGQEEDASLTFNFASASRLDVKGVGKVGGKTTWTMSASFRK